MKFLAEPEITDFDEFVGPPDDPERLIVHCNADMVTSEKSFKDRFFSRPTVDWNQIFGLCGDLREQHDLGDEEYVVLLTAANNAHNWFAVGNPAGPLDIFVHTEDWDYFLGSDRRFPIAYLVATHVLMKSLRATPGQLIALAHRQAQGCIMDLCENKYEITLKLRTGDICPGCLQFFERHKVSPLLLEQVLTILDGIRSQMLFKSRFSVMGKVPALHIKGPARELVFPELGNLKIHLNPLEKTIFLFFLQHENGVQLAHLSDYRNEILGLYRSLSTAESPEVMEERVKELVNPAGNSCSEKISRIKRKIVDALGSNMAQDFIISGANGSSKGIRVDRSRVVFTP